LLCRFILLLTCKLIDNHFNPLDREWEVGSGEQL
jgi:hypothetical protein